MAERKVVIAKDWVKWNKDSKAPVRQTRLIHKFEQQQVVRSEDLPQLLTVEEASNFLRVHSKTVRKWIETKDLQSLKIKGRRFVTPEQIGEFLDTQKRKNG